MKYSNDDPDFKHKIEFRVPSWIPLPKGSFAPTNGDIILAVIVEIMVFMVMAALWGRI